MSLARSAWSVLLALPMACTAQPKGDDSGVPPSLSEPLALRVASFNASLHRDAAGQLIADLSDPSNAQGIAVATILQHVAADVVLLNELDVDGEGESLRLLNDQFLGVSQQGMAALNYEHLWMPESNTGEASGADLNGDGEVVTEAGSDAYGQDAKGYGQYPGQYGLAVVSRFPIVAVRTFRDTLWRDLPDHNIPPGYYSEAALDVLPLSSKTHADVTLEVGSTELHLLVSHPTPPAFDGEEDRNGRRNHDEIAFWTGYLDATADSWHTDDDGSSGGLKGAPFVILGDLNADPADGGSFGDPMGDLLSHPRVVDPAPMSRGGTEQAEAQGGVNGRHTGDPALDTADFSDQSVGNLRVDYALPSVELSVEDSGVFWPAADDPLLEVVESASDHRAVWVDVQVGG